MEAAQRPTVRASVSLRCGLFLERGEHGPDTSEVIRLLLRLRFFPPGGPVMKDLLQFLAQQLVNDPQAVDVKETQGDTASVLELRVAKEDLGRIIGKQGRTAKSIRTILNAVASRQNRKVVVEIVED
jgi:predicted RNA-binding protein YlqC (UPF0109 family)